MITNKKIIKICYLYYTNVYPHECGYLCMCVYACVFVHSCVCRCVWNTYLFLDSYFKQPSYLSLSSNLNHTNIKRRRKSLVVEISYLLFRVLEISVRATLKTNISATDFQSKQADFLVFKQDCGITVFLCALLSLSSVCLSVVVQFRKTQISSHTRDVIKNCSRYYKHYSDNGDLLV